MDFLVQAQGKRDLTRKGHRKRCPFFICETRYTILSLLLRGVLIGISISAPVGPIGVPCNRHTLSDGKLTGFLSGMGAASADMVYGAVAAFGLTVVLNLLVENVF